MANSIFMRKAERANSLKELINIFDSFLPPTSDYGVEKQYNVSIDKARLEANRLALKTLDEIDDPSLVTEEQKEALRAYTGRGGIGGSTDEYYTPKWLAGGVWSALAAYGADLGNILEPSAGTGVFNASKPSSAIMTATELDETSSRINQILNPSDEVLNMNFEKLASDPSTDNTFDAVVGNVPFGNDRGTFANDDPAYKNAPSKEAYFILRAIDKVKHGGYVTLVVPQNIVSTKSYDTIRKQISLKAEFLGAHKIPTGAFAAQGSASVGTDVIVLRKHSEEMTHKIEELSQNQGQLLKDSLVLYKTFINGQWFKEEGKRFIHGELKEGGGNFGADQYVVPGLGSVDAKGKAGAQQKTELVASHNASTAKKLAQKFDSRIDWNMLDLIEPEVIKYNDGDTRFINGRQHEYEDGIWLPVVVATINGGLNQDEYGVTSTSEIDKLVETPSNALSVSYKQLKNVHLTFGDKTRGSIANAFNLAAIQKPEMQERVTTGVLIGNMIEQYKFMVESGNTSEADILLAQIQSQLTAFYERFGSSHGIKLTKPDFDSKGALSKYNSFVHAMNKNGEFSDFIATGEIDTEKGELYKKDDAAELLRSLTDGSSKPEPITLDEFRDEFTGQLPDDVDINDDEQLINHLATLDEIAVDVNGHVQPMDRATSGIASTLRSKINEALIKGNLSDAHKANLKRQLDLINSKQKRITKSDIKFKMRDKWIPDEYILQFLEENGYDDLQCTDGYYHGYANDENREKIKAEEGTGLIRQVENYLNGETVRGGGEKGATARRREQIRRMEVQFHRWMMNHDDIDILIEANRTAYHDHIPFEHSESSLGLKGISGNIKNMPYQNSAIRRLSEEGRGILGFGTGLGKTFTALGLARYNVEKGRSKRVCIVVPKAVGENWINETCDFYGYGNMSKVLVVGHDFERTEEGSIKTEPVLDENGDQKAFDRTTGEKRTRPVLRELSDAEIASRMNQIPHSNVELVIMTKERFAAIPLKADTILDNVKADKFALEANGHLASNPDSYKSQQQHEAADSALSNEGTDKNQAYPFFEDMQFDDVIVDEGHNYRNASKAGQTASRLKFLATGAESKIAVDMRQKMQYLGRKNNGRGAIMLTATPTPNSPLDIYNMLRHLISPEEMLKYGVANQDDFISIFGFTEEVPVTKVSGERVYAEGLTGFTNLPALRAMLNKYINRKGIKDVASDTKVPEVVPETHDFEMNETQKDAYEYLRLRAEVASAAARDGGIDALLDGADEDKQETIEQILIDYPDDQIFSIIRDMDRVSYDVELYQGVMSFIFEPGKSQQAKSAVEATKQTKKVKVSSVNEEGETIKVEKEIDIDTQFEVLGDGSLKITINEHFESDFVKSMVKHKLSQKDVTHPISPKLAKLIEDLRNDLPGGKQIIFSEEKSQHKKLHRTLCQQLNLESHEIGILNGDTAAGNESASNADKHSKLSAKKRKELEAKGIDVDGDGLEAIANEFNNGKFKILICNKKAEVGVNLHIGTTGIKHLTLPWTPASLEQRNGRGARVGAPQEFVKSTNYIANGSFDRFRLDTIEHKADWQTQLLEGDALTVRNEDADSANDKELLLARNPEEREALIKANEIKLAKEKLENDKRDANDMLRSWVLNVSLANSDPAKVDEAISEQSKLVERYKGYQSTAKKEVELYQSQIEVKIANGSNAWWEEDRLKDSEKAVKRNERELKKESGKLTTLKRKLKKIETAKKAVKRLEPQIKAELERAELGLDREVFDNPSSYIATSDALIAVGGYYLLKRTVDGREVESPVLVRSINVDDKTARIKGLVHPTPKNDTISVSKLGERVAVSTSDKDIADVVNGTRDLLVSINALGDTATLQRLMRKQILSGSAYVLTRIGDEFEVQSINYAPLANAIVPEKTPSFTESFVHYYLNTPRVRGSYNSRHYHDVLRFLLGESFQTALLGYIPNAPTKDDLREMAYTVDISSTVESALNEAVEVGIVASSAKANLQSAIESEVKANLSTDEEVKDILLPAVKALAKDRAQHLYEQLQSELESALIKDRAANAQRYKELTTTGSDEDIRVRLTDFYTDVQSNPYRAISYINTTYNYSDGDCLQFITDLQRAGFTIDNFEPDTQTSDLFTCYLQDFARSFADNAQILSAFMGGDESIEPEEVEPEISVPDMDKVDLNDSSVDAKFKELKKVYDIDVKRNSEPLNFKSKRGVSYLTGDAFEYVAFHDPHGKGGQLQDTMSPMKAAGKAAFPMKKFATGIDEFGTDFWWFVHIDHLDEALESLLS